MFLDTLVVHPPCRLPVIVVLVALVHLACTGKDGPDPDTGTAPTGDGGGGTVPTDGGGTDPGPDEPCNGIDDDGDGLVDEAYPDVDKDGRADCLQCALPVASEVLVEPTTCSVEWTPSDGPWNVEPMWEWRAEEEADGLDFDGCRITTVADIDQDGYSEILCQGTYLHIVEGRTGERRCTAEVFAQRSALTVADMDRDGELEIYGLDGNGRVAVVGATCEVLDTFGSDMGPLNDSHAQTYLDAKLFDSAGNGEVHFAAHRGMVSLASREKDVIFQRHDDMAGRRHAVSGAHLDSDEFLDYFTFRSRWDHTGWPVWRTLKVDNGDEPGNVVILADDSGQVLIGWAGIGVPFEIWHPDGYSIFEHEEDSVYWGLDGCAGDVDGDGGMEIIMQTRKARGTGPQPYLMAFDPDGTEQWRFESFELSGGGYCVLFDFDGDGANEILVPGEFGMKIHSGSNGALLWDQDLESTDSTTNLELVIPIDLDLDGSVELIRTNAFGAGDSPQSIQVFRHVHRQWPPGAPFWVGDDWNGTQLQTNGTVPRVQKKAWETTRLWRGQPTTWVPGADLDVEVLDSCVAEAEVDSAEVRLRVAVLNRGPEEANTSGTFRVTGLDEAGAELVWHEDAWEFIGYEQSGAVYELLTDRATADRGITLSAAHGYDIAITTHPGAPLRRRYPLQSAKSRASRAPGRDRPAQGWRQQRLDVSYPFPCRPRRTRSRRRRC